jgi:hypothetical protein
VFLAPRPRSDRSYTALQKLLFGGHLQAYCFFAFRDCKIASLGRLGFRTVTSGKLAITAISVGASRDCRPYGAEAKVSAFLCLQVNFYIPAGETSWVPGDIIGEDVHRGGETILLFFRERSIARERSAIHEPIIVQLRRSEF